MKTNNLLRKTIFMLLLTWQSMAIAQNQSILLPFSGDTDPATGTKTLNFINSTNPVISTLPKHIFYTDVDQTFEGDPHDEGDLHAPATYPNNLYLFNEKYLGQHPMFAQQVVHDKDGNLLFFIVDNNIYNRYGYAFQIDPYDASTGFKYLHTDAPDIGETEGPNGKFCNRFGFSTTEEITYSLDPEIVIIPILDNQNVCNYKYRIVYSIFNSDSHSGASGVYTRTLTYIDDEQISLSEEVLLSADIPVVQGACRDESVRNLAVSKFDDDNDRYLLFVRFYNYLSVFSVDEYGNIPQNNGHYVAANDIFILPAMNGINDHEGQFAGEMEVCEKIINNTKYYWVAMGSCYKEDQPIAPSVACTSWAHMNIVSVDEQLNLNVEYEFDLPTPDNSNPEFIKGLEFSPDGNKLFFTFTNQEALYYYSFVSPGGIGTLYISDYSLYQYSEIELGRDGNLYYLYSNSDGSNSGVSRLESPNSPTIQNFHEGIFDIDRAYFSNTLGVLPLSHKKTMIFADQIDGGDYMAYYNTINLGNGCCETHIYYSNWPEVSELPSNSTWNLENSPFPCFNGIVWIKDDVHIPSGKEITIENMTFKFAEGKKLFVDSGAKLILDNAVLTSVDDCPPNGLWGGVEVQGSITEHGQKPRYIGGNWVWDQGRVEIINGGSIKNAECGIYVGARDEDGNFIAGTGGGIVQATGGIFRNCKEAVVYNPYNNLNASPTYELPNFGKFANCTFEITGDYYINANPSPGAFITLNGVHGLNIIGNDFKNTSTLDLNTFKFRGNGILCNESSFQAVASCLNQTIPCTQLKPNTFENLYYGIIGQTTNPLLTVRIKDNEFINNFRGIRLEGINHADIRNNTFDVGPNMGPVDNGQFINKSYGLHLEGCTGYKIQENSFTTDDGGFYGAIITNSGTKANMLNNNEFTNFRIACQAEGVNGSEPYLWHPISGGENIIGGANVGLIYKCNDFVENSLSDINITNDQNFDGIIDVEQGVCGSISSPAGNTFNGTGMFGNIWASNEVTPINYSHHSDYNTIPNTSNPLITRHDCGVSFSNQSCLIPNENQIATLKDIINLRTGLANTLHGRIDGGSTQDVLDYIDRNPGVSELKYYLIARSPYVSDEALIQAIIYLDTIGPSELADIIVANSPVTYNVMDMLTKINMKAEYRAEILEAQTGTSMRFLLEDSLTNAQTDLDYASNELLGIWMNDTAAAQVEDVIDFYMANPDYGYNHKIISAEAMLLKGESGNAKNVLDSIVPDNAELLANVKYLSILCDTAAMGDSIINLSSVQLQTLQSISEGNTRVAVNARVLLEMALDTLFEERIQDIEIPDSMIVRGNLYESSNCNSNPVAGNTLVLQSPQGMVYDKVTPVITDANGGFAFNPLELARIKDTVVFSIATKSSFSADALGAYTRTEWLNQSPLNITLEKLYNVWNYKKSNTNPESSSKQFVSIKDNIYFTRNDHQSSNGSMDMVMNKIDSAGQRVWEVVYDKGVNLQVVDVFMDDSLKNYVLVDTSQLNSPATILELIDSVGEKEWEVGVEDINFAKAIIGDGVNNVYVIGDNALSNNQVSYISKYTSAGTKEWSTAINIYSSIACSIVGLNAENNIVVIGVDSTNGVSHVFLFNKIDGSLISDNVMYGVFVNNLIVDAENKYIMAGINPKGDKVVVLKFNSNTSVVLWQNETGTSINSAMPTCMAVDTAGNVSVLYSKNVGYSITTFNGSGSEINTVAENGNWYLQIIKQKLLLDKAGSKYIMLAIQDIAKGGFKSYLCKYDTNGVKQWEQIVGHSKLLDFTVSDNGNIYTTGDYLQDNDEFKLVISKFAQCYANANLRSLVNNSNEQKETDSFVKLYPNPNDGSMQLEYDFADNLPGVFEMYDFTGRKVYSMPLTQTTGRADIAATYLSRGVYMYRLVSGGISLDVGKVVVIK